MSAPDRSVVPTDLFAFGSRHAPRAPRRITDIPVDSQDMVGPEGGDQPHGASTFAVPTFAPLTGHFHRLPAGTKLPEGLGVVADGRDLDSGYPHPPSHHTIYPTRRMPFDEFMDLFLGLPWVHAGRSV